MLSAGPVVPGVPAPDGGGGVNTKAVNAAAGVIRAAVEQGRTPAGVALALDSAQLLQTPETAKLAAADRADVLRQFAARIDQMREDGDPSVWLSAWEAVSEVIDEAHTLAADATRADPGHVHDFRYSGPTAGTRCVGCHLPETAEAGDRS